MLVDELKQVLGLLVTSVEDEESGRLEDAMSGIDAARTALSYAMAVGGEGDLDAATSSLVDEVCNGLLETLLEKSKVRSMTPCRQLKPFNCATPHHQAADCEFVH